ncbi:MAG: PD40 domain-containing protein [Planctomycetes bacterium]|nr:PD40 domain-containing protein [Planctomycetota bacterium]
MKTLLSAAILVAIGAGAFQSGDDSKKGGLQKGVHATNLEKLNTEADEVDPFTADGLNLYYASNKSGRWEIMHAKHAQTSSPWPKGDSFLTGKDADCRSPFLQGDVLYFASNEVPDDKLKGLKNFDILKKAGPLAPFRLLGVNEPEDELHPWITPAGKEFYFSRKLKDGWKLFMAKGPKPGPIGDAKEVGFETGFHHAVLTPSTLVMYLEGPLENGRVGLFRSRRAKVGAPWSKPEPLVSLNHPEAKRGDMSPSLYADGTRLFFVSDRPGGKGGLDIWTVWISELQEK